MLAKANIYLRLIRWPNLLLLGLTQYMVRHALLEPLLNFYKIELHLSDFHFLLLVLSTMLLTAAGYIINDYFDVRTDFINKPEQVTVGTQVSRREAMSLHTVCNITAIILGIYTGWQAGNYNLGVIHIIVAGLLWFYSTSYKKQFLVGNVIISILTAMVVLIVGFYERHLYTSLIYEYQAFQLIRQIMLLLLGYAFFAFMISLIREIIKDIQDVEGDREIGSRTMPLVLGIAKTKGIVIGLTVILILAIAYIQYLQLLRQAWLPVSYITVAIQAPLVLMIINIIQADKQPDYRKLSTLSKIVMLAGVLSMVFFYLLITNML